MSFFFFLGREGGGGGIEKEKGDEEKDMLNFGVVYLRICHFFCVCNSTFESLICIWTIIDALLQAPNASPSTIENLNKTFSNGFDQASKIKEATEMEKKVDAGQTGGSQNESIPTLNRINL